jgi:hypothetical protein
VKITGHERMPRLGTLCDTDTLRRWRYVMGLAIKYHASRDGI